MTISNRAQIMADLESCLRAITKANGFSSDVATVKRGLHLDSDLPARPALCLASVRRSRQDQTCAHSEADLYVVVSGYVDAPNADFSALDALAADVEAAFLAPARNPWWDSTHIEELRIYEGGASDPVGIFELDVRVNYEYRMGQP